MELNCVGYMHFIQGACTYYALNMQLRKVAAHHTIRGGIGNFNSN